MTRKLTTFLTAAVIFGGLTAATTVFAEEANPSPQTPGAQGMMSDHGGMMNMMGQMSRMADNCNRMMESLNNAPNCQPAPDTHQ
jgi:hypothetical protein